MPVTARRALPVAAAALLASAPAATAQAPPLRAGWPIPSAGILAPAPDGTVLTSRRAVGTVERTAADGRARAAIRLPSPGPVSAAPDGTVLHVGQVDDRVTALSPAGRFLWRAPAVDIGREASPKGVVTAPDGSTHYAIGSDVILVLDRQGRIRSQVFAGEASPDTAAAGPDGTLFVLAPGMGAAELLAVAFDGSVRWRRGDVTAGSALALAPDGTVAVAQARALLLVRPDGSTRALVPVSGFINSVVATSSGRVFAAAGGRLLCVTTEGASCGSTTAGVGLRTLLAGPGGEVYAGGPGAVVGFAPDGALRWIVRTGAGTVHRLALAAGPTLVADTGEVLLGLALAGGPRARPALVTPPVLRAAGLPSVCGGALDRAVCRPAAPLGAVVRVAVARASEVRVVVRRRTGAAVGVAVVARPVPAGVSWIGFPGRVYRARSIPPLGAGAYRLEVQALRGRAWRVVSRGTFAIRPPGGRDPRRPVMVAG